MDRLKEVNLNFLGLTATVESTIGNNANGSRQRTKMERPKGSRRLGRQRRRLVDRWRRSAASSLCFGFKQGERLERRVWRTRHTVQQFPLRPRPRR